MIPIDRSWRLFVQSLCLLLAGVTPVVAQDIVLLKHVHIETLGAAGRIEDGEILIENGTIREIGKSVKSPSQARIIDLQGKTILPGIVDPYFVVNFPMGTQEAEAPRVVTFGGRTFNVPGNRGPATNNTFSRVADLFDERYGEWSIALRSGITTANVVTNGYGQSVLGNPLDKTQSSEHDLAKSKNIMRDPEGLLFTTVTNDSTSLGVVRNGLRDPASDGERNSGGGSTGGRSGGRGGFGGGRRGGGGGPGTGGPSTGNGQGPAEVAARTDTAQPAPVDPSQKLWESVRGGQKNIVLNANNAAGLLYLLQELNKAPKAQVAVVANGSDWYHVLDSVQGRDITAILPPRIDTEPGNQVRLNVPRLLNDAKVKFVFSTSSGQTEFRSMQNNPLFPVAILCKSGLGRQSALEALTIGPARILGIDKEVGTVEVGKRADLLVLDGDPLDLTTTIEQVWIDGNLVYGNQNHD